ncbi:MAG: DNA topoisomerase VI subunit B [Bdellovibrionales bacterium GWC1_52_8]|nr:MAG: DNA topoisomerase VI subunit B [Bdellovibrionales bacterium GWA1_52_35]OFZ42464.1 MAG: DNA topoisomerase VI subunit B [Bdellovibrionales bacterium GWC1_52_8]HCM39857.1 DNA topoisomerase VI subunit B [Bdellovibrionales bacterium]
MAKSAGSSKSNQKITTSSTAEYFAKNLQQVGFSSQTKAILTTLKESVDNALDACEEAGVLPEVSVFVEKIGAGSIKNSDQVRVRVEDNGPGIDPEDVPKVFGEYLASSKFGRGRCSRGQQGIGISAATTWAQLTTASGARVITKTANMRKAVSCTIEVDIKHNKGVVKDKETIDWNRAQGTSVEFLVDGRIQLNGEAGLLNYLNATTLVNPHLTLHYKLPELERQTIARVSEQIPEIPDAVEPHPHTMKLGEFIAHSHLFGRVSASAWLKKGFSRVHEGVLSELVKGGTKRAVLEKSVDALNETEFKALFVAIQNMKLMAPSTRSVLSIGEDAMAKSIQRLGAVDFYSVVSRKPAICDFKPVQVEVAVARLEDRSVEADSHVQVLRFANRVPLQFDKSACAIVHAIESVNWRAYGLGQSKSSLPFGPYIIAVSVVSPFIKFKNASKETVDASDELVEEIRRALIQAGQKLSKHLRREVKANELEEKLKHIEQFCPILVQGVCNILKAPASRKKRAEEGLLKILGRDTHLAKKELDAAHAVLEQQESEKQTAFDLEQE